MGAQYVTFRSPPGLLLCGLNSVAALVAACPVGLRRISDLAWFGCMWHAMRFNTPAPRIPPHSPDRAPRLRRWGNHRLPLPPRHALRPRDASHTFEALPEKPKKGLLSPLRVCECPRCPLLFPTSAEREPRGAKMEPRGGKMEPRWSQEEPQWRQEEPKLGREELKWKQNVCKHRRMDAQTADGQTGPCGCRQCEAPKGSLILQI